MFPRISEKSTLPTPPNFVQNLLEGFPNAPNLETLRASFKLAVDLGRMSNRDDEEWVWDSWDDNWTRVVRPLVLPNVYVAG